MTHKLAFLALVTDAFGARGGIAQYNRDFLCALAGSGLTSSITAIPRNASHGAVTPAGIRQTRARMGRSSYSVVALSQALAHRFDAVFCGHLFMAPLSMLIARMKRAKLIVQVHGIEAWQRPKPLTRAAVGGADLVLCVSRHTRAALLQWAAIPPERVLVLPNTVDQCFTPGDAGSLRTAWRLDGKRVLLTVGRMASIEQYKGHDRVLEAIPHLLAQGHDVVYVILGEGDDRNRLEALALRAGIGERVRFMGNVSTEVLVNAYRMADVFVMPSTGEGFGIAFLEATASGTPALGLAVAGARDALADGELGTMVSEADIVSGISRLLTEPKADPHELAEAVRARFGKQLFRSHARSALLRLFPASAHLTGAGLA